MDRILQELTPVESITEADALRDFFQNINLKNEVGMSVGCELLWCLSIAADGAG